MSDERAERFGRLGRPSLGARVRGLFEEAWTRARRRRRRIALAGVAACAAGVALTTGPFRGEAPPPAPLTRPATPATGAVAPRVIDANDDVPVTFTAQHATGVFRRSAHVYAVSAMASNGGAACVNNRDRFSPDGIAAGARVTLMLAVRRGEGGELGWCPGAYRGTVTYFEGFRCPATGRCRIPAGFPHHQAVVARFSYRVPARSRRSATFVAKLQRECDRGASWCRTPARRRSSTP